jgi:hypothetical protein
MDSNLEERLDARQDEPTRWPKQNCKQPRWGPTSDLILESSHVVPHLIAILFFLILNASARFFRDLEVEDRLLGVSMSMSMSMSMPMAEVAATSATAIPAEVPSDASSMESATPDDADTGLPVPLPTTEGESTSSPRAADGGSTGSPRSIAIVALGATGGLILAALVTIFRPRKAEDSAAVVEATKDAGRAVDDVGDSGTVTFSVTESTSTVV